jgi:hypothetical protein
MIYYESECLLYNTFKYTHVVEGTIRWLVVLLVALLSSQHALFVDLTEKQRRFGTTLGIFGHTR